MRSGALALAFILGSVSLAPAQDADKALAVVDKAIKALGGEANLAKFKAQTWKEKGTYFGMGEGLPYTGVYAMQFPDKFKMEIEGVFMIVLDGDKGWIKANGEVKEMTKEQLAEQQESQYAGWVTSLAPLKGKGYQLALIDDMKVEGKPAAGVKVTHKGHRDVKLFFDKKTGLLVKSEYIVKAEELKGKEVLQEVYYSSYKEVAGAKIPSKIVIKRDGKRFVEAENMDVKPVKKLPAGTFAKPE